MSDLPTDKSAKDQWNFRCDPAAKSEFEKHVQALNWSVPGTLEMLVKAANALFRGKRRPEAPLIVVDAVDDDGGEAPKEEEYAELKTYMEGLAERHLAQVRKIVKEAADEAFVAEASTDKLRKKRRARASGGRGLHTGR